MTATLEGRAARWLALALDWLIETALWLAAAPWFVLGWMAGALLAVLLFVAAALVAGFRTGYGRNEGEGE